MVHHMVTKNGTSNTVISLHKESPYSLKFSIKKSTYQDYEPRDKDFYIRDNKLIGFYIRIRPNGNATYNCEAKLSGIGKKVNMSIGSCELFTVEQAREIATDHLVKIKSGINPKDEIEAKKAKGHTLESLAKEYISIRDHLAETTKADYLYRIPQQLGKLARKDIQELTVDDFVAWWGRSKAKGSRKVALRYVSALLSYAKARKYIDENVAQDFRKGVLGGIKDTPPKQSHISKLEMEDWLHSLVSQALPNPSFMKKDRDKINAPYWIEEPTISETIRDYILFLLLTGKRKTEVSTLTWNNIDFDQHTITLQKTKSGKVDVIPMTNLLWHMLVYRDKAVGKHPEFVFHNRYRSGPIIDVRRALQKIDIGCGREHTTAHDLRRTFATMTRELGMTNQDTAILLNHAKRDVTEGYIITSREIKRTNLDKVERLILGHISGWMKVYWYEGSEGWDQGPDEPQEEREYYF